jgi:hypothetical protein
VDHKRPWEVPRVLGIVLGARVVKGRPEEAALWRRQWRGEQWGMAVRMRLDRKRTVAFYSAQARGDGGVMTVIPPCYGASADARTAGAVDGPAVYRAHGARTVQRRRGSRCLG